MQQLAQTDNFQLGCIPISNTDPQILFSGQYVFTTLFIGSRQGTIPNAFISNRSFSRKKNYTARQKRLSVDAIPRDLFDDEAAGSGKELESDSRSAVDSLLRKPAISLRLLSLTVALHTRCIHQCRRSTSSRIKCSNIDQKSTMHLSTYTASTAFNAGPP